MEPEYWEKVKEIYEAVLHCKPGEEMAVLQDACAGDDRLRHEVETLLAYRGPAEQFIERPALDAVAKAMAGDAVSTASIGTEISQYRIVEKLGVGGMGVVYRAHDVKLDRDVALKFLPEEFASDRERRARFEREARLLASLNHPQIASIFGLEESRGRTFLVMEFVDGETLAARIARGPISLD